MSRRSQPLYELIDAEDLGADEATAAEPVAQPEPAQRGPVVLRVLAVAAILVVVMFGAVTVSRHAAQRIVPATERAAPVVAQGPVPPAPRAPRAVLHRSGRREPVRRPRRQHPLKRHQGSTRPAPRPLSAVPSVAGRVVTRATPVVPTRHAAARPARDPAEREFGFEH